MEPLDDIAPERVGHHHQNEDRLIPDDAQEELAQVRRPRPLHVEQADEGSREGHEIGHTEVDAPAAHTLDEDRAGQHQDGQEDGIDDEDAQGEDETGEDETGEGVDRRGHADHGGEHEHRQPRGRRPGEPLPGPRSGPGAPGVHFGTGAHRCVGGTVIGLVGCRSGLRGRPMNRSGRSPSGSVPEGASSPPSAPNGRISRSPAILTTLGVTGHRARRDTSAPPWADRRRGRGRSRVPSAVDTTSTGVTAAWRSGRALSPTRVRSGPPTLSLPGHVPSYPGSCPSPPKVSVR